MYRFLTSKLYNKSYLNIIPNNTNIRNFCIIAHIDHGKSTLADRFLEITNTIPKGQHHQYLDKLKVEKDRGITVQAQSVTMYYQNIIMNLIDTPGHVDFHYEVIRSMRSCKGALLLVDATQGVQAQTIANYDLAKREGLKIIPVINKIDVPGNEKQEVANSLVRDFDIKEEDIKYISAKSGQGVKELLDVIIEKIEPTTVDTQSNFKAFIIGSWFVKDKGVVLLADLKQGSIKKGDSIVSCAFKKKYEIFEVGIMNPEFTQFPELKSGQVGYIFTNMKTVSEARIGDTFYKWGYEVQPLPGFEKVKPMVYVGIYPEDPEGYVELNKAIQKLILTDPAVIVEKESSSAMGNGFRCGFLGILHMDVFKQRLDDEYEQSIILTTPSVPYRAKLRNGSTIEIDNAMMVPEGGQVVYFEEPMAEATVVCPQEYAGEIISASEYRRGHQKSMIQINNKNCMIKFDFPLAEIIVDFFDKIKSMTKGYGTLDFEFKGFKRAEIVKLVIHIMNDPIDTLSFMVHKDSAQEFGKNICKKLKERIPPELFVISIQARVGGKSIAKEDIPCLKKNVTAKCYGGDYSRKKKLLERQKEGKKKQRKFGKVTIDKDTFIGIIKKD